MTRKSGKPKELEDSEERGEGEEFIDFAREFFPHGAKGLNQPDDYPSIDWLKQNFSTKSAVIRYLYNLDPRMERVKDIAKMLDTRYQHVRNVVTTQLKRGPNEDWTKPYKPNTPDHRKETDDEDKV